jgi:hypothetical protein
MVAGVWNLRLSTSAGLPDDGIGAILGDAPAIGMGRARGLPICFTSGFDRGPIMEPRLVGCFFPDIADGFAGTI